MVLRTASTVGPSTGRSISMPARGSFIVAIKASRNASARPSRTLGGLATGRRQQGPGEERRLQTISPGRREPAHWPCVQPQSQAGTIKAYAIASTARNAAVPTVPTTSEAGLPECQASGWFALFAPKATPKPILDKLTDVLDRGRRIHLPAPRLLPSHPPRRHPRGYRLPICERPPGGGGTPGATAEPPNFGQTEATKVVSGIRKSENELSQG